MPVVFAGFFLISIKNHQRGIAWLGFASFFFYGYLNIYALPIIGLSILVNYWFSKQLYKPANKNRQLLLFSIVINLLALGYFKYANFFIANTNTLRSLIGMNSIEYLNIALPIGISFYTFSQIAFLIDTYQGKVKELNFLNYILFVTFFPHLLAGPILHYKQIMPQFLDPKNFSIDSEKIKLGIIIFTIGLAKKLLIADALGDYANFLFDQHEDDLTPTFLTAWIGSITYTFQLYFDFSGYSDMAVGLSLFFGILIPFNFNSPFKSTSIIDFWQKWHISLTKYVNEYLYTPITLKFMRFGQEKPQPIETIYSLIVPTMVVFLILGLWHGASWNFVIFGAMHGLFIVINHLWRKFFPNFNKACKQKQPYKITKKVGFWALTFISVNLSFVMFRAKDIATAMNIYKGMFDVETAFNFSEMTINTNQLNLQILLLITICFILVIYMPNTSELTFKNQLAKKKFSIKGSAGAIIIGLLFSACVLMLKNNNLFLYYKF